MIKKFLDFGFDKANYITLIALIIGCIYVKAFNVTEVYENTIFENLAIIPLFVSIILCLKMKTHRVFFITLSLFLFLIIAREFNYGRVLFCALPDNPHDFYPWSHYKYGWLAHIIVGAYIILGSLWAVFNKIWVDVYDIIQKVKFPVWTFLFSFILVITQVYCEKIIHNSVIEELAELGVYCFILVLCMIYTKKLKE